MTKTKLHKLTEFGQSIWLDYIRRLLIKSGDLAICVQSQRLLKLSRRIADLTGNE